MTILVLFVLILDAAVSLIERRVLVWRPQTSTGEESA
jgi:ABC-type nitrate/sulfonate/bicarbonate transport system permease component